MLFLLFAQASAVDAERAFAADAQKLGQWTAFRKWATEDAVMFWPQPVKAQEQLKPLKDPPRSVTWQPILSLVSCDGTTAVNTGASQFPDGSIGYFTTVWQRQPDGSWKWSLDAGDKVRLKRAVPARPAVWKAACTPALHPLTTVSDPNERTSPDNSLRWTYGVQADGSRYFVASIWTGVTHEYVIRDRMFPAAKP